MKANIKTLLTGAGIVIGAASFAQPVDMNLLTTESDVTVTMDLQPVLELQMTTPDQINFTFNTINSYMAGITHYGATVLRVSSTVEWDLVAVGTSSDNEANQTEFWDNPVQYSATTATKVPTIPISALELQQTPPNPIASANTDYSVAYAQNPGSAAITTSANAVEVGNQSGGTSIAFQTNTTDARLIAGDLGALFAGGVGAAVTPGSYLSTVGQSYNPGDFKYTISYRIVPGLPAVFPLRDADDAALAPSPAANQYAAPGVYTMEVRYVLTEDQ